MKTISSLYLVIFSLLLGSCVAEKPDANDTNAKPFAIFTKQVDVFGTSSGTSVAAAMDLARGGHFETVPDKYPDDAWYSYYDQTCDYGCMIIEYLYWAHTSILGAQDFPGRLQRIEEEWRLNTREKVEKGDPAIYALFTDAKYKFATVLADGDYKGGLFEISLLQAWTSPGSRT